MKASLPPRAPDTLRLILQGLSAAEAAKVGVFITVAGARLGKAWAVVPDGEAHVVIVGGRETATIVGLLDDPVQILQLVDAVPGVTPPPGTLVRPLQYDALVEALEAVEARLDGRAPVARRNARPPGPAPAAASPAAPAGLPAKARFRLRRWPSSDELAGHRYHVRLASFLSSRAMSLDELSRLSNVEPADCAAFVDRLHRAGLLQVQPSGAAEAVAGPASVPPAEARSPAVPLAIPPRPDGGLLSLIRRRFGLGAHR